MKTVPLPRAVRVASVLYLVAFPLAARADTWTFSGSIGGIPVDASAVITEANGSVTFTLNNLETNAAEAAEFTWVNVTFGSTLSSPTLTSASGNLINIASNGSFSSASPGTMNTGNTHWGTNASGHTLCLATVQQGGNACALGSQPFDLIIGPPGPGNAYTNGGALSNFNPHVQDTASFTVAMNGFSANTTITSVQFGFGTTVQPVNAIDTIPGNSSGVPGPIAGAGSPGLLFAGAGLFGWRLRKRSAAVAT